jgi:hypothetical protein
MKVDAVKVTIRKMRKNDWPVVSELAMLPNPHMEKAKYAKHIATALKACPNLSFVAVINGMVFVLQVLLKTISGSVMT